MNELLHLVIALVLGVACGVFFFAGLWWTVRQVTESRRGAWILLASYFVRLAVVSAIFLISFRDHAGRLAAALVGFLAARAVLIRWLPARGDNGAKPTGAFDAPQS